MCINNARKPSCLPRRKRCAQKAWNFGATIALAPSSIANLPLRRDWHTEYLDAILSVKVVNSLDAAIAHINRYGSRHTDSIVTRDAASIKKFMTLVDSADVFANCSTRFSDGFLYGFGAEVGIATGKIHARGPMGLEGLCTYKYKLYGQGHTLADLNAGKFKLIHRKLEIDP